MSNVLQGSSALCENPCSFFLFNSSMILPLCLLKISKKYLGVWVALSCWSLSLSSGPINDVVVAFFANSSIFTLLLILVRLGSHHNVTLFPLSTFFNFSKHSQTNLDLMVIEINAIMAAWLSKIIVMLCFP